LLFAVQKAIYILFMAAPGFTVRGFFIPGQIKTGYLQILYSTGIKIHMPVPGEKIAMDIFRKKEQVPEL